jgi:hypothetical protein
MEYGSKQYNEKRVKVTAAIVAADSKSVTLEIEDLRPNYNVLRKQHGRAAWRSGMGRHVERCCWRPRLR